MFSLPKQKRQNSIFQRRSVKQIDQTKFFPLNTSQSTALSRVHHQTQVYCPRQDPLPHQTYVYRPEQGPSPQQTKVIVAQIYKFSSVKIFRNRYVSNIVETDLGCNSTVLYVLGEYFLGKESELLSGLSSIKGNPFLSNPGLLFYCLVQCKSNFLHEFVWVGILINKYVLPYKEELTCNDPWAMRPNRDCTAC